MILHQEFGISLTFDGFHRAQPLGRPPVTTQGVGSFTFTEHQPGAPDEPVAYDPCREVEYAVNTELGPAGASAVIEEAVRQVSRATGLVFRRVSDTEQSPVLESVPFGSSRVPVVIGWTTPEVVEELAGDVAGLGGSATYPRASGDRAEYRTGIVALDAPQLLPLWAQPGGREQVRAIVLHELGHLVGLAHVDDPGELMYDGNVGQLTFGPGDREGLAALGSGRCSP